MKKLQSFEQQACTLQEIIAHFENILETESKLYSKLLDPPIQESFTNCVLMAKRLLIEKQILEQSRAKQKF
jgi:hypothetical protein